MKNRHNLKTPERFITMGDGETWRLRLDNSFIYELEKHTGRTMDSLMKDLSPKPDPDWAPDPEWKPTKEEPVQIPRMLHPELKITQIYDLAYAMSASHREDEGQEHMTFRQFLRKLPAVSQLDVLTKQVLGILTEGLAGSDEAPRGNDQEPAQTDS